MRTTRINLAFILAGALLMISAFLSQVLEQSVSQVLILGLSGLFFVILSRTPYGKKQIACEIRYFKKNPLKALGISLGVALVFGGIGFMFGKLLHYIIH